MTVRPAKTQFNLGIRPVWTKSLLCAQWLAIGTLVFFMRTAKILIRLGGCPGWFEPSLGAQSFCWFCHEAAQMAAKSSEVFQWPSKFGSLLQSALHPMTRHLCYVCKTLGVNGQMSRDMTKPTKWLCAQRRLRSAWAFPNHRSWWVIVVSAFHQ